MPVISTQAIFYMSKFLVSSLLKEVYYILRVPSRFHKRGSFISFELSDGCADQNQNYTIIKLLLATTPFLPNNQNFVVEYIALFNIGEC